jgi:hypothetical protein
LPRPNPSDKSGENCARFEQYLARAVYYNATGRTLKGLLGLAFAKDPQVKAPAALDDVLAGPRRRGHDLGATHARHARRGREDRACRPARRFPEDRRRDVSRAGDGGRRAAHRHLLPGDRHHQLAHDGRWQPGETFPRRTRRKARQADGVFGEKCETQYRALILEDGVYRVEIWRKKKETAGGKDEYVIAEPVAYPMGGNGAQLTEIPFTFVGSKTNGIAINKAPIYDIADVNIAHYRNSADYEDSVYISGQPQFWIAGLDEAWRDHLEKTGLYMARAASCRCREWRLRACCRRSRIRSRKRRWIERKGKWRRSARASSSRQRIKTATQQESEDTVANSVLSLCCDNVSAAYTSALEWVVDVRECRPARSPSSIATDFTKFSIAPEELNALVAAVQRRTHPALRFLGAHAPGRRHRSLGKTDDAIKRGNRRHAATRARDAGGTRRNDRPSE